MPSMSHMYDAPGCALMDGMSCACSRMEELHGVLDAAIEEEAAARGRLDESKVQKAAADKVRFEKANMDMVSQL